MPNIMDYARFQSDTTVPARLAIGPLKVSTTRINNGRGTLLSAIDNALQHWHNVAKHDPNPKNQAAALYQLAAACKRWQIEKAAKMTNRNNLRRHAIMNLGQSALDGLYEIKKLNRPAGHLTRPNKALARGYNNERAHYIALKGRGVEVRNPYSANDIAAESDNFQNLTPRQFEEIGNRLTGQVLHVRFYNRTERMEFLVRVNAAGLLEDIEGHLKNTDKRRIGWNDRELVMYVMDRYGNLFVMPDTLAVGGEAPNKYGYYINHSSILAGKNIVCAGTVHIQAGHLVHIDNDSGHYKPTPDDLRECLAFLQVEEGLDLTDCRVMTRNPDSSTTLYQANTFLANGASDWGDALEAAWNDRYGGV